MPLAPRATPLSFVLTADIDLAKAFYAGVLGLPMLGEDDFAVTFDLGGGARLRLTPVPAHAAGHHTVLGWAVPDIRRAMVELAARGVEFTIYQGFGQDESGVWSHGDTHVCWFRDPDGNVLSLTQFG